MSSSHNVHLRDQASDISRELDEWQSPKLGTLSSLSSAYQYESSDSWLNRGSDDMDIQTPAAIMASSRTETPVMSNSSNRTRRAVAAAGLPATPRAFVPTPDRRMDEDLDEGEIPVNIQSPWALATAATPAASSSTQRKQQQSNLVPHIGTHVGTNMLLDCRRYYEAFSTFLSAKRRLQERWDLQQKNAALMAPDQDDSMEVDPSLLVDNKLVKDEAFCELDFLRALHHICWTDDDTPQENTAARKEGNFWWLMHTLRSQGVDSLIFRPEIHNHPDELNRFLHELAHNHVHWTPQEVADHLHSSQSPLALQRRYQILQWLHDCFAHVLPRDATRVRYGNPLSDSATLKQQGLVVTDKDEDVLKSALQLILAGRLPDALQLARDSGEGWRAAVWGGGKPQGKDPAGKSQGNSRRFLWKKSLWAASESFDDDPAVSSPEGFAAPLGIAPRTKSCICTINVADSVNRPFPLPKK